MKTHATEDVMRRDDAPLFAGMVFSDPPKREKPLDTHCHACGIDRVNDRCSYCGGDYCVDCFPVHDCVDSVDTQAADYVPARGDLVQTPDINAGLVTAVRDNLVSVRRADGRWETYDVRQLVPYVTNEYRQRVANFAGLLPDDLESMAPGFTEATTCDGCGEIDVDLVESRGEKLCPTCIAGQRRKEHE